MHRTKILATIGPASEEEPVIAQMISAGMDIARFNTKHNLPEWHQERIHRIQRVAKQMGKEIPILLDLQGPEIRIKLPGEARFSVKKNDFVYCSSNMASVIKNVIVIPPEVFAGLQSGHHIVLDDGICEFVIIEKDSEKIKMQALDSFDVNTNKTMNTPDLVLDMPSLLEKDIQFLESLKNDHIEYVGLSFVRNVTDIEILRSELKKRNMSAHIVAKIENQEALRNLSGIIDASDAVMVARGDLGVEIPFFQVPYWQKKIIAECNQKKKFVITATHMLLTMVERPRPSRAEVSDVANAVYDGTDAVMLSEETAMGKYPVKAIDVQAKIVEFYEQFV